MFRFWHILLMLIGSGFYGLYLVAAYKIFGKENHIDDFTLTFAGSLGSVLNGGSKVLNGILADKIGFKKIYYVVLILQIILASTIYFIAQLDKAFYVIWVGLSQFALGAHFTLFPYVTARVFGIQSGGILYSILFNGFTIGSLLGFFIQTFLHEYISNEVFFFIATAFSACSLVLLYFFNDNPIIKENIEDLVEKENALLEEDDDFYTSKGTLPAADRPSINKVPN